MTYLCHASLYRPRVGASPAEPGTSYVVLCIEPATAARSSLAPAGLPAPCRAMIQAFGHPRYIAHGCGWGRYITHGFLWIGPLLHPHPLRYITHRGLRNISANQGLRTNIHSRNPRARLLTRNFFNAGACAHRYDGVGDPRYFKAAPAEAGGNRPARELRSLLSCSGYACAAGSTSLGACRPQNRLRAVSAPPLVYPESEGAGREAWST